MTHHCRRVLENLGRPLTAELSQHVGNCQSCQALLDAHRTLSTPLADPPAASRSAPSAALGAAASRPARQWWIPAAALAVLNLVLLMAAIRALQRGAGVANLAPPTTLWALGALLLLALVAGPIIAIAPAGRALRRYLLLASPLIALALILGGSGFQPAGNWIRAGIPCLVLELSLSLIPAIFTVWALTASAFRPSRAAMAGIGAGAVGALALHVHCPFGSLSHLLCFHLLPWAALVGVAVALRSRLPSRSFAP